MPRAILSLLAISSVGAAEQIMNAKNSRLSAINEMYDDVNTELLTINVNQDMLEKYQSAGMRLDQAFKTYDLDPEIAQAAMKDMEEMMNSP